MVKIKHGGCKVIFRMGHAWDSVWIPLIDVVLVLIVYINRQLGTILFPFDVEVFSKVYSIVHIIRFGLIVEWCAWTD